MLHYVHYKLIWSVLQYPCYKNKEKNQLKVYKMKQLVNSYCQQVSQKWWRSVVQMTWMDVGGNTE